MNHLAVAQGIPIVPDGPGGGYYDTSFGFVRDERVESPVLIGVAHDFQKVDLVPSESWDMPLEPWDGIRNYQVRNFMRDAMTIGDRAFFYHSSCKVPGIVGMMEIVSDAYPDHTAWDPEAYYFDPKSDPDNPMLFDAITAGESALEAKEEGFNAGLTTNLDVLDAQRDLSRSRTDYLRARYDYIISVLELERAVGDLDEDDIKRVNGWL